MATGIIYCGICGFTTNVKAVSDDSQSNSRRSKMIKLEITSDCPNYQKIAKELTEVDAYKEILVTTQAFTNPQLCATVVSWPH